MTPQEGVPLASAGTLWHGACHACAFFRDGDEAFLSLKSFARGCVACADRCFHFVDPALAESRRKRLAAEGIVDEALSLRTWSETTLQGSRFDAERMLDLLARLGAGDDAGGRRTRIWADMEWALAGNVPPNRLIAFESRINTVMRGTPILLCAYDVKRYDATTVLGLLGAHPALLAGDRLLPNPLYVAPPGPPPA